MWHPLAFLSKCRAIFDPLRLALYGHPDAGGFWEKHCEEQIAEVGFEPVESNMAWRSCYVHRGLKLFLVVYVDDFKMAGPRETIAVGWQLLRDKIKMDEPTLAVAKWTNWGFSGNDGNATNNNAVSSSFLLEYSGTTETQVVTMLAHAKYGEVNYSNNPTSYSASVVNKQHNIIPAHTGAHQYVERPIKIKNVVSASWTDQEPPRRPEQKAQD